MCKSEPVELDNLLILQTSYRNSGEMYAIFAALQWFLVRLWHISNFRPMKIDWTHAKICITRFHVVTQQLYTPELHVHWIKSIWLFEKVPKGDIQVINCPGFYQIVRDYVGFSELCRIMRRRWNYAILHPRIIPWGLHRHNDLAKIPITTQESSQIATNSMRLWNSDGQGTWITPSQVTQAVGTSVW